jgi:hypothetical protein
LEGLITLRAAQQADRHLQQLDASNDERDSDRPGDRDVIEELAQRIHEGPTNFLSDVK